MILTVPAATPVTLPVVSTEATEVLELVHVMGKFDSAWPFAFDTTAESAKLWLISRVALTGVMATERLAGAESTTVTVVCDTFRPDTRKIFAIPGACAVTTPFAETVATETSLELHLRGQLPSSRADASCIRGESVNCDLDSTVDIAGSTATGFASEASGTEAGSAV